MLENVNKDNITDLSTSKYDFSNLFKVSYDENNDRYFYNINKSIYIQQFDTIAPQYYETYEVQANDTWTIISYKFYGTVELWWLVCKTNQITNPTINPTTGDNLKILSSDIANDILRQMRTG